MAGRRKKLGLWLLAVGLALLLLGAGSTCAEILKVSQQNQSLYPDPDFAGTPITAVPVGAELNVERQVGDWYKVEYQGKTGWINRQAFPPAKPPAGAFGSLPGMLFGAPVKETKSDEVALAGKGFTPEVESGYRQKHPEANFAQVDRVEGYRVDPAKLQTFLKEGDLKP